MVEDSKFRILDFGLRVSGFGLWVSGLELSVHMLGFRGREDRTMWKRGCSRPRGVCSAQGYLAYKKS